MGLVSQMYKAARAGNKISVWSSGNPTKILNHYKNVILTKAATKNGVFRKPKGF